MYHSDIFNAATVEGMLEAPGIKWHRDPPDVIPLWLADPDFPLAPSIKRGLLNAVHDEDVFYNTDVPAREAMVEKIVRRNKLEIELENVMLTQGVIPGMWLAIKNACKQDDEVIVTDPMYFPFFIATEATNTRPIHWKLDFEAGYEFDVEVLKELITPKTKLLFVCNPHNPCGRVMTKEELKGIADVCVDHGIKVMVDELWEDIVFDDREHISLASLNPEIGDLTITSWGFSKTWGIPGLQIGYFVATNMELMDDFRKISKGVLRGTNTLARAVAPIMLSKDLDYWKSDMIEHLTKIRRLCKQRLEEMGDIVVPDLEGTYLMFPKFNYNKTSQELYDYFFEKARVSFSLGSQFGPGGDGHLRMLIATSEQIMNEALDRVEKALPGIEK
jgi:bifunctional pyridoxal-dependent enzyme with beta-cystathionase and maltose regulon repressor activities